MKDAPATGTAPPRGEAPAPPGRAVAPGAAGSPAAAFPPAVTQTLAWLQTRFAWYYTHYPPAMPDRFTRREFGYILFPEKPGPPPFVRHKAFDNQDRFHWLLAHRPPHSVYYSTAYYRRPGELKMADKQWLGAELIFDLDADHLDAAEKAKAEGTALSLSDQLRLVREQFKRLLDEFLFGDFGLSEDDVWLSFSGSRGYHAHVVEPRFLQLGARERREIVDYVTGKFPVARGSTLPDLDYLVERRAVDVEGKGKFAKVTRRESLAPVTAPGWPGRLTRSLVANLEERVLSAPPKEALAYLVSLDGVGPDGARKFLERFDQAALDRLASGAIDQGPVVRRILHHLLRQWALPLAKGETDEPVTADTKRLIRLPGSLHGKSGLAALRLRRDDLDHFDPLRDAVAFGLEPVTVTARADVEMELAGERIAVKKGEPTPVPEAHAVFLCSRQMATIAAARP